MDIVRLREKIVEFTKTDWKKYPTYEHALQEWAESLLEEENKGLKTELKTAYRKGMRHMAKALKDYDRKFGAYTDYFEHTVDTVLQKEQVAFEEVIMSEEEILRYIFSCVSYKHMFDLSPRITDSAQKKEDLLFSSAVCFLRELWKNKNITVEDIEKE